MKVLTVILALLVVALSVMPCCFENACAIDDKRLTEQTNSHDSNAEACSPFYSCATCIGFTISIFAVERTIPITYTAKPIAIFKQSYLPPFPHAIWQPPKLS